jgi:uncharacterized protein (TIGR02996 family)
VTPPELQALLQACKDEPDEDAPRLVLADWLEEHGQPDRAEFVRLQLRLAREDIPAGDEAVTLARLHELYLRHADDWLGALQDVPGRCRFRRGLIEMTAYFRDRPAFPSAPQAVPWLETLVLKFGQQKALKELVTSDLLSPFTSLDVTDVKLAGPALERLGRSQAAAQLRRLRLELAPPVRPAAAALGKAQHLGGLKVLECTAGLGDAHLQALAGTALLANLSTLSVRLSKLTRKCISALAQAVHAPRLTCLEFCHFAPGEVALAELVRSPVLAEVRELQLTHQYCCDETEVHALAARAEWPRLERLSFEASPIADKGIIALASLVCFPALRRLHLGRCRMTAGGLSSLLAAPWLAQLQRLDLQGADLGEAGATSLARCPALRDLRHLGVHGCQINAAGVAVLAASPYLSRLETLDLSSNPVGDMGLAALAEGGGLPALTALFLNGTRFTGNGLARLTRSRLAGQLRRLELGDNQLSGPDLRALHSHLIAGLRDLGLERNPIDEEGARMLAQAPFRDLVRLNLEDNLHTRDQRTGGEGLLSTHGFPRLTWLNVSGWALSPAFRHALRAWPRLGQMGYLSLGWMSQDQLDEFGPLAQSPPPQSPAFCLD